MELGNIAWLQSKDFFFFGRPLTYKVLLVFDILYFIRYYPQFFKTSVSSKNSLDLTIPFLFIFITISVLFANV